MREETIARKKKREKMKEDFADTRKQVLKGKGKLTTSQQNHLLLNEIKKKKEEPKEEIEEATTEKVITHRTFRCSCGYTVSIEGTSASDLSITKCSKCSKL